MHLRSFFLYIFFCSLSPLFSQNFMSQFSFDSSWKKVERLENELQTKDALETILEIEAECKKEANQGCKIKCIIYKAKYNQILMEDDILLLEKEFNAEIEKSKGAEKSILQSYLAQFYWKNVQNNRWKYLEQTEANKSILEDDFRTWSYQKIRNKIHVLFQQSLANKTELIETKISEVKTLIDHKVYSEIYRPTLFDVLAHHAIEFYTQESPIAPEAIDNYSLTNDSLISDYDTFSNLILNKPNSFSSKYECLLIFQKLISIHKSNNIDALIDVDLLRLRYVETNLKTTNLQQKIILTLEKSEKMILPSTNFCYYSFEKAAIYFKQGEEYTPKNNINQFKKKESLNLLSTILQKSKDSFLLAKANSLLIQITNPTLNASLESYIPTNYKGKFLVEHKNIAGLLVQIYKYTEKDSAIFFDIENTQSLDLVDDLENPLLTKIEVLKNEGDMQLHTTELPLPKLPLGYYVLKISSIDSSAIAFSNFVVTNLGIIQHSDQDNQKISIVNRKTGSPIKNANVTIYYSENYYDNAKKSRHYLSNDLGVITPDLGHSYNTFIQISNQKESVLLPFNNISPIYKMPDSKEKETRVSVFTDRSIYRPGQTVFFKGIVTEIVPESSKTIENQKCILTLRDANYHEVSTQTLVSNDFGSFDGFFILPISGLTGTFSIHVQTNEFNSQTASIQVEEYKRPKFELKFDPIERTYEVNEMVTSTGKAISYSGTSISDAKVTYSPKKSKLKYFIVFLFQD